MKRFFENLYILFFIFGRKQETKGGGGAKVFKKNLQFGFFTFSYH